ncbi:MAG: site-2 protease family protein [Thermoplasmata archaeon]
MNGYLIALVVFLAYVGLIYALNKKKWFEKHNMSLMGPLLMWKTQKGRDFIEKLATRKRFWGLYGKVALWICAGSMLTIMLLLLWEATIVSQIAEPPSPELILGIPGVNPVIPLGYGVLALVIAIVVHEFAHGILTRVGQIKVQSLGLVFLVLPIGAFVEPDEKELKETTRRRRSKVYAVGPASNIILALVTLALFSGVMMSSAEPSTEGALAFGVVDDSPAAIAGISPGSVVVQVDDTNIRSADDLVQRVSPSPGSPVAIRYYYAGKLRAAEGVVDGVVIAYAARDFAAYQAGMRAGMVLVSINDTAVGNIEQLTDAMAMMHAGQSVDVMVMSYDSNSGTFKVDADIDTVQLSDKWEYYAKYNPDDNDPSYHGVAYLGAGFLSLGMRVEDVDYYSSILANPFEDDNTLNEFSRSWLRLVALPFLDLAPIRSPVTDLYHPSGSFAWMPDSAFWLLTNSLYWIFWLNLMVGLTNVLPAVPFDGGYLFREGLDYVVSKSNRTYTKEERERIVGSITTALALLVLALILWQMVGPAL